MEERTIEVTGYYLLDKKIGIRSHTAEWCKPCQNIKPVFDNIVKKIGVIYSNHYTITEYKKEFTNKIPFFEVLDRGEVLDQIQSSDKDDVTEFFNKYIEDKLKVVLQHPKIGDVEIPQQHIKAYMRLGDIEDLSEFINNSPFDSLTGDVIQRSNELLKRLSKRPKLDH